MMFLVSRILRVALVIWVLAPGSARAEEPDTLTLPQAIAAALHGNPALLSFEFEFRAQDAKTRQAALGPAPELQVTLENFAGSDWWLEGLMHNVQGRLEMRRGLLTDAVASLSRADQIFVQGGATQGHFFMLANLAICYLLLGRLSAADEALKLVRAVFKGELDRASAYAGVAQAVEALFLYERNELSAAGNAAQLALAGLERAEGCFEQYFISTYAAVRAAFATSGYEAAMRMIERGRRLSLYHGLPRLERLVDCLQARLHIDAEQWDEAEKMAPSIQGLTIEAADGGWLELDFWAPVHALLALHHGRLDEARDIGPRGAAGERG